MPSSRVADPPLQVTVLDSSMHTDASAVQIKSHQLSSLLDELEQWAVIVPSLSLDQRQEISEHLQEQMSQLAESSEPNGTRKQQFIDLERLTKLQRGPLGKLVDYGGFLVIMDDIIRKRLQALSSAAVEDGSEVLDSTASSQILTPASSVGIGLGSPSGIQLSNKELESDGTLSLEHADDDVDLIVADPNISAQSSNPSSGIKDQHMKSATGSNMDCFCEELKPYYPLVIAIRTKSDEYDSPDDEYPSPEDHIKKVHLTINGPEITIVGETQHLEDDFGRELVNTVEYHMASGKLSLILNCDDRWLLEFEHRKDARTVLSLLAYPDNAGKTSRWLNLKPVQS